MSNAESNGKNVPRPPLSERIYMVINSMQAQEEIAKEPRMGKDGVIRRQPIQFDIIGFSKFALGVLLELSVKVEAIEEVLTDGELDPNTPGCSEEPECRQGDEPVSASQLPDEEAP